VKQLCGSLGFIPVTRDGRDSKSLKAALRTLDSGHVLGIFPEGRISPSYEMLPFQSGLAMIAQRTGASVPPVAIEKLPRNLSMLESLLIPRDARIFYGPPLHQSNALDAGLLDFRRAVQTLQQQALAVDTHLDRSAL